MHYVNKSMQWAPHLNPINKEKVGFKGYRLFFLFLLKT